MKSVNYNKMLFLAGEDGRRIFFGQKAKENLYKKGENIMAFRATLSSQVKSDFFLDKVHHFWAISKSVGWGNRNEFDDVLLVQYLVNKCAGKKVLETDGQFGSKTWNGIKNFQKLNNWSLKSDGRVTAIGGDTMYPELGGMYTIQMLNYIFHQEKRIYYDDPRMDPDLPNAICTMISKI